MDNFDFKEELMKKIEDMKQSTLDKILAEDINYQISCKAQMEAEGRYMDLNLTEEQKQIVDELLIATDSNNRDYSILSYLAGVMDSGKLQKALHLNALRKSPDNQMLQKLYDGELYPAEQMPESDATASSWKQMVELEEKIKGMLDDKGIKMVEELHEVASEAITSNMFDTFEYSFRLGAKLLIDIMK